MKKRIILSKKILAVMLCCLMALSLLAGLQGVKSTSKAAEYALQNPQVKNDVTTWDCIYFGNYWQNDTNGDGVANQSDGKQPIKWRVLSVDGDDALILADTVLDLQKYNAVNTRITWEKCTLRKWLNNDFFTAAFDGEEQSAIRTTHNKNEDNPYSGIDGGNDTDDNVFLLSIDEVCNNSYGFVIDYESITKTRCAKPSNYADYTAAQVGLQEGSDSENWRDIIIIDGYCRWTLRSIGYYINSMAGVLSDGSGYPYSHPNWQPIGIRPALHIDLSSSCWSYAGEVSSETSDMTYLAMSELAYCNCSRTNGKTIEESGKLPDYIKHQQSDKPNDIIPHQKIDMTKKEFVTELFNYIKDWKIVDVYEDSKSGFYAVALERGNEHVLAFRGSQNIVNYKNFETDWLDNITYGLFQQTSKQMKKAISVVSDDKKRAGDKKYILTGHSLGGGLAVLAGNYIDEKAVAFDGSPTTDVSYYKMPDKMSKSFKGIDKWKSFEYINENCPVGNMDKACKNYISLKDRKKTLNPLAAHERWAIVDYNNGLSFSPPVGRQFFEKGTTIKKNMKLIQGIIHLGSGEADHIESSSSKKLMNRDIMYGGDENDYLCSNNGDDILCGGQGDDTLDGGTGNDTYMYWKNQGTDMIYDPLGNDKIDLYGFDSNDTITINDTDNFKELDCNGNTILQIWKKRGALSNITNSLVVNLYDSDGKKIKEVKLQDWSKWKNIHEFTFACPVKVQIFDENNNKVLELEEELKKPIYTDYGQFYVNNEDGELVKHVILEEGYRLKVIATDNGTMDFYSNEDDGQTAKSNYAESIKLEKNDIFEVKEDADKIELYGNDKKISLKTKTTVRASEIRLPQNNIKVTVGSSVGIKAALYPGNSTETLKYISSNPEIASVDNKGNVKGIAKGECEIGLYSSNGLTTNVNVKVDATGKQSNKNTNKNSLKSVKKNTKLKKPGKVTGLKVKNKKKKKIVVKWRKKTNVSGYQIQYALNKKFTKKKKSKWVGKKKSSKTISKLKKGKKYYIRVRAYRKKSGKKLYGKWSKVKKVKIKK